MSKGINMFENIKLVICDIDWTLLSRQKRTLSPYSIDIFEKMHKKGIYFGIAICDISTGDFYSTKIVENNNFLILLDELAKYRTSRDSCK